MGLSGGTLGPFQGLIGFITTDCFCRETLTSTAGEFELMKISGRLTRSGCVFMKISMLLSFTPRHVLPNTLDLLQWSSKGSKVQNLSFSGLSSKNVNKRFLNNSLCDYIPGTVP